MAPASTTQSHPHPTPTVPPLGVVAISQLMAKEIRYKQLKLLQEMLGSHPLIHKGDVCEAHAFCMEQH